MLILEQASAKTCAQHNCVHSVGMNNNPMVQWLNQPAGTQEVIRPQQAFDSNSRCCHLQRLLHLCWETNAGVQVTSQSLSIFSLQQGGRGQT